MNHILNRYLPFLMKSSLFLPILDTFWAIFGHFSYSTSINDYLSIKSNYLLNWISIIFFELNNILNWILGEAILNQILNGPFFWQNSNIELNQIGYRTLLASCDLNTRIFSKMCVCSNLWRVKSLGERESSGFGRHRILLPPQIGQLAPPRFYFIIRQINWIRVKSRQQTHEASNFGFNFWPRNHS